MRAFALVALLALTADARTGRFERFNSRCVGGRTDRGLPCDSLAWFEAFPTSGAGLPSAANLCDTLTAAEKVGNWWCLNGDGTMASGSAVTLTATGSPTQAAQRVCPNGSDCASRTVTSYATNATNYIEPSNAAFPASDFTACALVQMPPQAATSDVLSFGTGTAAAALSARPFEVATTGALTSYISNGAAASSLAWGVSLTTNARHLLCYTYQRVGGAANNVQRTYLDGTAAATNSTANLAQALSSKWSTNGNGVGLPGCINCNQDGAFVTYTLLDATAMARIARAVLADAPTGARGEALSETRASVQFCESSDGTGSLLPNNRLCVTRNGTTAAQGAFLQSLLQTEALGNATWADVSTPTITSDSTVSAGGTLTADTVDDNNAAAFEGRSQTVTVTAAAAYTMSCYAKAGTLAKIRLSLDGTTGDTTTLSSSSWTRVSVTDVSTSGVSVSAQVLAGTATTDTGTVIVWGCNVTPGSSLRPYIPATSAAVTTAAEVPYFALTAAPALNSIEVTVDTPATFTPAAYFTSIYKDATNRTEVYLSGTKLGCYFMVGGVAYEGLSSGNVPVSTAGVRISCSYDGTNVIACIDGTCNSTARSFTNFAGATRAYVGASSLTGYELNPTYVIRGVKADPNSARFR